MIKLGKIYHYKNKILSFPSRQNGIIFSSHKAGGQNTVNRPQTADTVAFWLQYAWRCAWEPVTTWIIVYY